MGKGLWPQARPRRGTRLAQTGRRVRGRLGAAWNPAALLALLVVIAAWVAGGCSIQVALNTVVHGDGSADVRMRLAADRQIQSLLDQQLGRSADQIFADVVSGVPLGWQTEQGTDDDGTRWVVVSRAFADLAEVDQAVGDEDGPVRNLGLREVSITQADDFFRQRTSFRALADPAEALAQLDLPQRAEAQQLLGAVLQVENRLTLPGHVSRTNADEREDGAMVWTLAVDRPTEMVAASVAYRWGRIVVVGLAALVALIGVVLGVLVLRRGSRS